MFDACWQQLFACGQQFTAGAAATTGAAIAGANVVLGVRDVEAGEAVARDIAPEATGDIRVLRLELRDLVSVAAFVDEEEASNYAIFHTGLLERSGDTMQRGSFVAVVDVYTFDLEELYRQTCQLAPSTCRLFRPWWCRARALRH